MLIQEPEQVQRNSVARAVLHLIQREIAVWDVLDLVKRLACTSDFEDVMLIHQIVAFHRQQHAMCLSQLIDKERLAQRALVHHVRESIHLVGVVQIDLVRTGQRLVTAQLEEQHFFILEPKFLLGQKIKILVQKLENINFLKILLHTNKKIRFYLSILLNLMK